MLGNFEGWKPRKVGGCRWTMCRWNQGLSHVAQDMACCWFEVVCGQCMEIAGFGNLASFWEFLGHIWGVRVHQRAL